VPDCIPHVGPAGEVPHVRHTRIVHVGSADELEVGAREINERRINAAMINGIGPASGAPAAGPEEARRS